MTEVYADTQLYFKALGAFSVTISPTCVDGWIKILNM